MFKVGDKVVYPMHGAGVIEAIEEREVLGKKRKYYILRLPLGDMKVMIPLESEQAVGLREVIDEKEIQEVIKILKEPRSNGSGNWNRRYRANLEKMRSGNIYQLAEVVGNLSRREHDQGLSTGERKMLENARQMLISELALARNAEKNQVENMLEKLLA
ncbi:CarD family transcriptional regulator [Neomoorella thermoacetica]|uniref:RNA polymerase-binding transcription factor CarD n=3 Tax=Neomoorella thermoacetica TaxID=1525 RepID=A0A1D7XEY2_NEOTH|nr:CarD family transcriptional regulator [Moorella thermoacetica]AKX95350.1 RNA polymerase-binding transcription factor CarD [Moorella thermoacetica]AKX97975.1 RNA polymerase-binding transcription factor CarD [Moorella thermoacetica]AOQ25463.1 RNA polymerase-binding transcription factor CarD [Moorella thermoacetica]APC09688.1 RNA polymerase-binding transcription factor CarD [Moorella thermoacetica]OIQ10154.1 RNA polymerase-binding transcription factor CarD [Moorella thermoacetica]